MDIAIIVAIAAAGFSALSVGITLIVLVVRGGISCWAGWSPKLRG